MSRKLLILIKTGFFFLSMGLHIQKKMNYHILEVYTVGSLQICSHNKDCNVQGRKITMLQTIYQKKSPTAIDSVSSRFPTPLLPSNPTQLPCRVFHSASVSLHIVSFQTNIHVPLINHHFRKLQAGRPGMKCWRVV